jgi:hypothetical protein
VTAPIGTRMEPAAPAGLVFVCGPRKGREEVLDLPGGLPTIGAVDAPSGRRSAPGGRWRMGWPTFDAGVWGHAAVTEQAHC